LPQVGLFKHTSVITTVDLQHLPYDTQKTRNTSNMKFAVSSILLALLASASASVVTPRAGANGNRPVASGNCCIANTSLKQDACNSPTGAGRCVPGGGGANCELLSSFTMF
jgi:hypothetical protein